jgi:hypothetical protein
LVGKSQDVVEIEFEELGCILLKEHRVQWLEILKTMMNIWGLYNY